MGGGDVRHISWWAETLIVWAEIAFRHVTKRRGSSGGRSITSRDELRWAELRHVWAEHVDVWAEHTYGRRRMGGAHVCNEEGMASPQK